VVGFRAVKPTTAAHRSLSRGGALRAIGEAARACGWRQHNAGYGGRTANGYADGFPDIVLIRGDRLVFLTLAIGAGVTPPAGEWLDALNHQPLYPEAHIIDPRRFAVAELLQEAKPDA
jgi:hypothetical protein